MINANGTSINTKRFPLACQAAVPIVPPTKANAVPSVIRIILTMKNATCLSLLRCAFGSSASLPNNSVGLVAWVFLRSPLMRWSTKCFLVTVFFPDGPKDLKPDGNEPLICDRDGIQPELQKWPEPATSQSVWLHHPEHSPTYPVL